MRLALPSARRNEETTSSLTVGAVDAHWGGWRPSGEVHGAPPLAAHFRESLRGRRLPPPTVVFVRLSPRHGGKLHALVLHGHLTRASKIVWCCGVEGVRRNSAVTSVFGGQVALHG